MRKWWIALASVALVGAGFGWAYHQSEVVLPREFERRVAEMRARGSPLDVSAFEAAAEREPSPGVQTLADTYRRWRKEHPDWADEFSADGPSDEPIQIFVDEGRWQEFEALRDDVADVLRALEEATPSFGGPAPPAYMHFGESPVIENAVTGAAYVLYEAQLTHEREGAAEARELHLRNALALLTFHDRLPYRSSVEAVRVDWVREYGLASIRSALLDGAAWEASSLDRLDALVAREWFGELSRLYLYERAACVTWLEKPIPDDVSWADRWALRRHAVSWLDFLDGMVAAHAEGPRAMFEFDVRELNGLRDRDGESVYEDWVDGAEDNVGLYPLLRSVLTSSFRGVIRTDADARLGRVALAVKRHLDERGDLPESVDALGELLPPAESLRHPIFGTEIELVVDGEDAVLVDFVEPSDDDPLFESRWVDPDRGPEPWRVVR